MTERMPVDGPFRVYVDVAPTGVKLDLSHYLTTVLLNVAAAADEDPESLLADLFELAALARSAAHKGVDSHAAHERDELAARLLAEVAGDGRLPIYGDQVARLAERLRVLTLPRPVLSPTQPKRGAA